MSQSTKRRLRRITVVSWSEALGDTLQLAPALRALRAAFPLAAIHLCGGREAGSLLIDSGLVDTCAGADDPRLAPLATGRPSGELIRALHQPELVIAFTSAEDAASSALAGAGIVSLVVSPLAPPGEHAAEHLLRSLTAIPVEGTWTGPQSVEPLRLLAAQFPDRSDAPVLLHPGSGSKWKCAPGSLFRDLAGKLSEAGEQVAVLEGPADAEQVRAMTWRDEVIRPRSIRQLAQAIASRKALIGNDSGVTHLAGLLGVPTVAIFGPTHPVTWQPMGPRVAVVRACDRPPTQAIRICHDRGCLARVSVEMVLPALRRVMSR